MKRSSILILLTVLLNNGYAQKTNKVNAEYYLLDKKGNKISASFSHIGEFSNQGYAIFAIGGNSVETSYGKIPGAKYGIIHESGKIIVPASYDYLEEIYSADSVYISSINGQYGLLNENGKTIISIFIIDDLVTIEIEDNGPGIEEGLRILEKVKTEEILDN